MNNKIDFGICLSSFARQYIEEDGYGIEQMFQILNRLHIHKFEITGAQMFQHYPNPSDEEVQEVLRLAQKYHVIPYSYDGYVDFAKHPDTDMSDDEIINEITFHLMTAHKLRCRYLTETGIPVHIYPRAAQMAAFYGVQICFRIHAQEKAADTQLLKLAGILDELSSSSACLAPDLECLSGYSNQSAEVLSPVLRHTGFFHETCRDSQKDSPQTDIPYAKLLQMLSDAGFEGTVMTAYEGPCYSDDAANLIAHFMNMQG